MLNETELFLHNQFPPFTFGVFMNLLTSGGEALVSSSG